MRNDINVRIGIDSQLGNGQEHLLPLNLQASLDDQGIRFLHQIEDPTQINIWQ